MTRPSRSFVRIRQQGQTLIIALIVLGVLLILGLVFLGVINRNILNASRSQRRSESTDLATGGVQYALSQLVSSPLGADWRGLPTPLSDTGNITGDPDAYYLRPKSGLANDLGGPDRLGPFIRVNFPKGRALVRVRYGATDASPTPSVPGGPLRNPGAAHSSLIIEAVGRPGVILANDPTTLNANGLQYQGFTNEQDLSQKLNLLAQADGQIPTSRKLVAFANVGIIDAARFETNVFNSSAPIDLGVPQGLGLNAFNQDTSTDVAISDHLSLDLGTPGPVNAFGKNVDRGSGSMIVNGTLRVFGNVNAYLNRTLGDGIRVAGPIQAGDGNAQLHLVPYDLNGTSYVAGSVVNLTQNGDATNNIGSFDSQNRLFDTGSGLLQDGTPRTDQKGFPSGVGRLEPPSTLTVDPQTKLNRYVAMTRETGVPTAAGPLSGAFGHGEGVYVGNTSDRQEPADDNGRTIVGSQRSLVDDWLNPHSGAADSGWQGPFYVPVGASVQLLNDGFVIQLDSKSGNWRDDTGTETTSSTIRYRVGRLAPNGPLYIVDSYTSGVGDINGTVDYTKGRPFNGVLYFEGNARVRGVIPTDVQLTIVSGATIYIEGSILKGTEATDATPGLTKGSIIDHAPQATLMLMAKDNVAVNTTTFFGPSATQQLESVNDTSGATTISPVRLRAADGRLEFLTEIALDVDSTGPSFTPSSWRPYALNYRRWDATGTGVPTWLMLGSTMDDGTAAASFFAMDVNANGSSGADYLFTVADTTPDLLDNIITNTAVAYAGNGATVSSPYYGLGSEPWEKYANFQLRSFPLIGNPTSATYGSRTISNIQTGTQAQGYGLLAGSNYVRLKAADMKGVSANDTLIGRAAVSPADVKIEASIFAEQGSFFVIPGPWFNPNPNDTRETYRARVAAVGQAQADQERLDDYHAAPTVPFYGEPLDIRLRIVGSIAENLPPPISVQAEIIRKWGWIPDRIGATGIGIPVQHVPADHLATLQSVGFVPNLIVQYDPILATGTDNSPANVIIRQDALGRPLPPMPRLPVSPKLAYFGDQL